MKTPTQARPIRSGVKRATASVALCALVACGSLKEGLQQAVLIDYDQANNFSKFELNQPVNVGNGQVVTEITAKGYWAYFVLCSLRNGGSKAQDFPYDMHNFYVDIDGQTFFDPKRLTLRYNGYPNVMASRNHAAVPLDPGRKSTLATVCRPSAQ